MAVKATAGLLTLIWSVSENALNNGRPARFPQGKPLRAAGVAALGGGMDAGGVIVDLGSGEDGENAAARNSRHLESGSQVDIPSRQPRSLELKRPVRRPS